MPTAKKIHVRKVTASELRTNMSNRLMSAKSNNLLLVENRRQPAKYVVDKDWLDNLIRERESYFATIEILADRKLTNRLLALADSLDEDFDGNRLYSMNEVFG
jgi:hypothetical protein